MKTSPKGFSASKCDVGNWIFSKLGTFWEIVGKFFGLFRDFGGNVFGFFLDFFWGMFWEEFLGGVFWEDFWEDFFGRIFWEDFIGRNSLFTVLKSTNLFESERDWCFCQDFVSKKRRRRKDKKFRSLEVRRQAHRT